MDETTKGRGVIFTVERRPGRVYICCSWFITYYHPITLARTTQPISIILVFYCVIFCIIVYG